MHSVISSAALVWLLVAEAAAQNCAAVTSRFQPKMGPGYQVRVIATGLRSPRHIRIDSAGNLLVAEGGTATVRRLVLKEQGGNVCVSSNTALTPVQSVSISSVSSWLHTSILRCPLCLGPEGEVSSQLTLRLRQTTASISAQTARPCTLLAWPA